MTDPRLTDIEVARSVAELQRLQPETGTVLSVEEVRRRVAAIPRQPDDRHLRSEDVIISASGRRAGLSGRVYTPTVRSVGVTLFFHGGGWVFSDLDTKDAMCRILARLGGSIVVSVDYRLAPEHPHPAAAVQDALDALDWVSEGAAGCIAPGIPIAVAGRSAGGNVAAVLAHASIDGSAPRSSTSCCSVPCSTTTSIGRPTPPAARNCSSRGRKWPGIRTSTPLTPSNGLTPLAALGGEPTSPCCPPQPWSSPTATPFATKPSVRPAAVRGRH